MERRIRGDAVQRSMGSIATINLPRPNLGKLPGHATLLVASRSGCPGYAQSMSKRPILAAR
jgi:hypothetical protein